MRSGGDRLAIGAVGLLAISAFLVSDQRFLRGEETLLNAVNDWPRWIGAPLELVMQLGTFAAGVIALVVVAAVNLPRRPRVVASVALAVLIALMLPDVLKELLERPRPPALVTGLIVRDDAHGFGFPSGHTTMAFALATVLHPLVPARLRWLPWVLATAVGTARVYVGVHWPMDIVGGAALGIAVGSAVNLVVGSRYGRRPA